MLDRAIGIIGIALSLIIGLWGFTPEWWPKMPPWATFLGIAAGIFLAGIGLGLIIADQRGSTSETSHVAKTPDLKLSLVGGNIFTPDANDLYSQWTGIALNARIWNVGLPSVATEWSMFVVPQNMTPAIAQLTAIPESLRLSGQINSAVIREADSLETKTKTVPIAATPVEGVLLFYVPIKKEAVLAATTRLDVIVKDAYGTETKVTKLLGEWANR